jgi:hypothetical protein
MEKQIWNLLFGVGCRAGSIVSRRAFGVISLSILAYLPSMVSVAFSEFLRESRALSLCVLMMN